MKNEAEKVKNVSNFGRSVIGLKGNKNAKQDKNNVNTIKNKTKVDVQQKSIKNWIVVGVDEAVPNPDPKSPDVLEVLKTSAQSSPKILSDLGLNRPLQSEKVETSENSLEMIKEKSKLLQLDPNSEIKGKIRTYGGPMPSKDSGWPKGECSYDQP